MTSGRTNKLIKCKAFGEERLLLFNATDVEVIDCGFDQHSNAYIYTKSGNVLRVCNNVGRDLMMRFETDSFPKEQWCYDLTNLK